MTWPYVRIATERALSNKPSHPVWQGVGEQEQEADLRVLRGSRRLRAMTLQLRPCQCPKSDLRPAMHNPIQFHFLLQAVREQKLQEKEAKEAELRDLAIPSQS